MSSRARESAVCARLGEGPLGQRGPGDSGWAQTEQKASSSSRSLKYLGSRTSEKVKNKILELLYCWTAGLPEEVKIAEAYQMLKKQGEAQQALGTPTARLATDIIIIS